MNLPPDLDRRRKLLDSDKELMRQERKLYRFSYNKLAQKFGCSKRLAIFICRPEIYEKAKEQFRERRKDGRYSPTREAWKLTMREHRAYKKSVM